LVKVDEVGTEAAAATAGVLGDGAAPPPPAIVAADRPFLFIIRDRVTGAILFLGRYLGPE
jgi:serpin B